MVLRAVIRAVEVMAAILMWGDDCKELSAGYRLTTNNRMELMAVIAALKALYQTKYQPYCLYR